MIPNRLNIGEVIGIVSPSTSITANRKDVFNKGIKNLNDLGFKVKEGKYVEKCTLGCTATKEEKAEDINKMFLDKEIKAIFSSKGGENSFSCLELINYENIKSNPKIIYGISDSTNYLNAIYAKTGLVTFHQSDVKTIAKWVKDSFEKQDFILRLINGQIGKFNKNSNWKCLKEGCAEGIIIGGNLKSIVNLVNTEYLPDLNDKILFIEVYAKSTPLELVDCYLSILKYHGVFNKIKGLWIGYYEGDTDEFKFEDIIMENIKEFRFPVLKCEDFGHDCENILIPIGGHIKFNATKCEVEIMEKIVG